MKNVGTLSRFKYLYKVAIHLTSHSNGHELGGFKVKSAASLLPAQSTPFLLLKQGYHALFSYCICYKVRGKKTRHIQNQQLIKNPQFLSYPCESSYLMR